MKARFVPLALIATLLLTFGALAAACGDDALTVEEYFLRLEELDNSLEAESAELEAAFDVLIETSTIEEASGLLQQQTDLIEEFVDGIDGLNPPDEAVDLHEEAVSAGRELVEALREVIDATDSPASLEEFFAPFESVEFQAAENRFTQVCLDAEQLAADNGISVDFDCDEDEG